MPIKECSIENKPGFKWGDAGKCYPYEPGNEESKKSARKKALAQGIAIGDIDVDQKNFQMDFLSENDTEIIRNILPSDHFVPDSFEIIPFPMNMKVIVGQLKDEHMAQQMINPGKKSVQGVKFGKPDWTIEEALEWLQENQRYFSSLDKLEKRVYNKDMKSIDGVQIFAAGTWNGDTYTVDDLNEMVKAFEENSTGVRPYLKLGHDDGQKLLQKDGYPAAGWIDKIYVKGEKLYADFVDIPNKVYELIVNKAYRKVSSEIMLGVKIADKAYKYMVSAVSLLGANTPGVMNLDDILALYGLNDVSKIKTYNHGCEFDKLKEYELENKGDSMSKTEKELELEKKTLELEAKIKEFEASEVETKKAIETLENKKKEADKRAFDTAQKLAKVEIEKEADALVSEELMPKSAKEFAMALMGPEKKTYSIGEDKELSKADVIKGMLKLFKATSDVNLDESSEDVETKSEKVDEEKINEEIIKYSTEHDVSYPEAYKAVASKYDLNLTE